VTASHCNDGRIATPNLYHLGGILHDTNMPAGTQNVPSEASCCLNTGGWLFAAIEALVALGSQWARPRSPSTSEGWKLDDIGGAKCIAEVITSTTGNNQQWRGRPSLRHVNSIEPR